MDLMCPGIGRERRSEPAAQEIAEPLGSFVCDVLYIKSHKEGMGIADCFHLLI
jgi:hypothetical protein